jgi:transposase InsO family protein
VLRLWRCEGLKVPQKRHLGTSDQACHVKRAEHQDHVWCWDFVFDRTVTGSPLKWLSIVDEYTRECLALKVDRSITSEDVIDTLAHGTSTITFNGQHFRRYIGITPTGPGEVCQVRGAAPNYQRGGYSEWNRIVQ